MFARNENALTKAKAFDLALVGDNYQGRYNKSKKRITTNDDLVNQYGNSFYQSENDSPRLAPNGKPSNLNPMQWAQVRTEAFKKWFGDWLYNPEMEMTPIKLIDDPKMPIEGDAKSLGTYLLGKYRNLSVINAQSGNEISIYRVGLLSSLKNRKPLARRLYAILPQLLEQSAYAGYEENTKLDTKPNIIGYESYYAPVSIDGKIYSVRILVDRVKDDARGRGYYYHQIEDIALGDPVGSTRGLLDAEQGASPPESSNGVITLGQLTGKVNNNASKVVDENGEPLVVYHGSPKQSINEFSAGNRGLIYVTEDKSYAEDYTDDGSGELYSLFANVKNPATYKSEDVMQVLLDETYDLERDDIIDAFEKGYDPYELFEQPAVLEKLKNLSYDGFTFDEEGQTSIGVFNSNQIKSATENNGDFNQNDANIYHQSNKNLALVHNLSLENLLHANKLGGIPVPSVAVVNKDHPMDAFGEITLIANKDNLGPQASAKNRFFNADIYSPRYPNVSYIGDQKAIENANSNLSETAKKIQEADDWSSRITAERLDRGLIKGLGDNLMVKELA